MKKLVFAVLFTALSLGFSSAQDKSAKDQDKEELLNIRINLVCEELGIETDKKAAFSEIYRAFRRDIMRVNVNKKANIKKADMTDENALEVVKARLQNQITTSVVKLRYAEEFATVITPLQVEKLYKVEEKVNRESRRIFNAQKTK